MAPPSSRVPGGSATGEPPLRTAVGPRSRSARLGIGLTAVLALTAALSGCAAGPSTPSSAPASAASGLVPRFDHVVIVMEENKGTGQVEDQPFLKGLTRAGASFSDFRAETHPSEPNYVALWSGSPHGVRDDTCPVDLGTTPSLGSQLLQAHRSVAVYAEGLPEAGFTGCTAGRYVRRHNPLADFTATSGPAHNKPFSAFPRDYRLLPDVSLVVPNLDDDMHDGSIAAGDAWLQRNVGGYATWAATHDSLLIVTFDEDEGTTANRIYTAVSGAHVRPGPTSQPADHYSLLHTIEASFGLPQLGTPAKPISVWR